MGLGIRQEHWWTDVSKKMEKRGDTTWTKGSKGSHGGVEIIPEITKANDVVVSGDQ